MISNLENSILKELDKQNFKADIISLVMSKLDDDEKKNDFLSFMIENRNVILSFSDVFNYLKRLSKECNVN
ncbi:MAG: hypothetical protein J6K45_00535 [Clostridia bacterium]|nr:hypothetical protein [Clostridia bacterium]